MKKLLTIALVGFSSILLSATPQGNHYSDCHPIGQNDRHSFKMTAYLDKGDFYSAFQLFMDKKCEKASLTVIYGSDYTLGSRAGELVEFDHTPTHVFMVLLHEDVVDYYNDLNHNNSCGIKDWEINRPRNVSGLYCHPNQMPTVGETLYDIFKYKNSVLQFGGIPYAWNITDPTKRPTKVHQITFSK